MSRRTIQIDDRLYDYLLEVSVREPPVLAKLREETAKHAFGGMQISPEQGQFMRLFVEVLGVRRALEVGVFTGYSSTSVALAMPPDGKLVACDLSDEFTQVARRYWKEAGVADKIELRLGPGVETLNALITSGASGTFDFAFVDADKENYVRYYEQCLKLVRVGGVIAFDNVLWDGRVADPSDLAESTMSIRALNDCIARDDRVFPSMLSIGDGLTLARRVK
ncbi:MAG TPA: class I SAM-dependent methyltransferase [Polyangiaceae bacterium]|jgi:caffeoyl-CoA O-methyltransferase|nr:class I SAM-dependent methyltransferase [Polyangiaceae bacterium]